jgi:mannosyltransferase OCH1-like enzyme
MHRSHIVALVISIVLFTLALHTLSTLLSLLFEDADLDVVRPSELPASTSTFDPSLPQIIPKIIHQTYINTSIPERWREARESCIKMHPDYEYKFWSDEDSLTFIEKEYPWFLDTFNSYIHPIQRADAIRYFILVHYGGIYIDLDNGCRRRLDPLLQFPAWLHLTDPTGISNDGMGATPRHPFFLYVIEQLQNYDRSWVLPYITIMSSTGPLFLSIVWKRYMDLHAKEREDWKGGVRILTFDQYAKQDESFFNLWGGSSWPGDDAKLFLWLGNHWLMTTLVGVSIGAVVGCGIWAVFRQMLQRRKPAHHAAFESGSPPALQARPFRLWLGRALSWREKNISYEIVEQRIT